MTTTKGVIFTTLAGAYQLQNVSIGNIYVEMKDTSKEGYTTAEVDHIIKGFI